MKKLEADSLIPVPPIWFEVMVSLAEQDLHGYAIIQDVTKRTDGRIRILPGTLYRAIARLLELGLIVEMESNADDDPRRRLYSLTPDGRKLARIEADRLATSAARARRHLADA